MRPEDDAYVPGEDVTELARPRKAGGTLVLSVRLHHTEVAALEAIAATNELSVSDALKGAVREYIASRHSVPLNSLQRDDNYDLSGVPTLRGLPSVDVKNTSPIGYALPPLSTDVSGHRERMDRERELARA